MPKYMNKEHNSVVCYAVQWFDTDECFEEIRWFLDKVNDAGIWIVDYTVKPATVIVNADYNDHIAGKGDYVAEEGDYIVRFANYYYHVIKKDLFEKQWEIKNDNQN